MAAAKKTVRTARGRKQYRARIANGQKYEVGYQAKKTGRSAPEAGELLPKSLDIKTEGRMIWIIWPNQRKDSARKASAMPIGFDTTIISVRSLICLPRSRRKRA